MTLTKKLTIGDVLKREWDREYTRVSAKLVNFATSGSDVTLPQSAGYPLLSSTGGYAPMAAGQEASCKGLLMFDKPVPALAASGTSAGTYSILRRGPAVVLQDALPPLDFAGGTITLATLVTALAALTPPIIVVTAPASGNTSVQTT